MLRACTGFDGGLENSAAIRRPGLRTNRNLNLNADNNQLLAVA